MVRDIVWWKTVIVPAIDPSEASMPSDLLIGGGRSLLTEFLDYDSFEKGKFSRSYTFERTGNLPWKDNNLPSFYRTGQGKLFDYVKKQGRVLFEKRTIIKAQFSVIADFYKKEKS